MRSHNPAPEKKCKTCGRVIERRRTNGRRAAASAAAFDRYADKLIELLEACEGSES
jgi:hypothetical protein